MPDSPSSARRPKRWRRWAARSKPSDAYANSSVPTVPGYDGDDQSLATLREEAEQMGFPLLIKASAGGGGRGMRVVENRWRTFAESPQTAAQTRSARRHSATMPCCSSDICAIRATSSFKCSPMRTARRYTWANANVRFNAAIKKSSRKRRRSRSRRSCAPPWEPRRRAARVGWLRQCRHLRVHARY